MPCSVFYCLKARLVTSGCSWKFINDNGIFNTLFVTTFPSIENHPWLHRWFFNENPCPIAWPSGISICDINDDKSVIHSWKSMSINSIKTGKIGWYSLTFFKELKLPIKIKIGFLLYQIKRLQYRRHPVNSKPRKHWSSWWEKLQKILGTNFVCHFRPLLGIFQGYASADDFWSLHLSSQKFRRTFELNKLKSVVTHQYNGNIMFICFAALVSTKNLYFSHFIQRWYCLLRFFFSPLQLNCIVKCHKIAHFFEKKIQHFSCFMDYHP